MLKSKPSLHALLIGSALAASGLCALAQSPGPQPLPMPPPIASPRDTPYPGNLRLRVDATDLQRRLFNVHETIPGRGGEPTVPVYPPCVPGNHSPTGREDKLAGPQ